MRKLRRRTNALVQHWSDTHEIEDFYLSVITVLEIENGIALVQSRDPDQAHNTHTWLETRIINVFNDRILNIDIDVAKIAGHLHAPKTRRDRDTLIAATALAHNLTVVTRNIKDFRIPNLDVINPWASI